jgi:transposase
MGKKNVEQRGYPGVKCLCFDEIAAHKGHGNYRLVISAPELGIVLDVLKDRKKETLEAWFVARGEIWCAAIASYCADMWDAYHGAAQTYLPNATSVVDRFHVMKNLNEALSQTRRKAQKKLDEPAQKALKGIRWLLVRNREDLTDAQRQELDAMLAHAPELLACYLLKESFRALFNSTVSIESAASKLDEWINQALSTGFAAMKSFVNTLNNWRTGILNYFMNRLNNGFAEGVNNKIKLIQRRAFGFHKFDSLRLHILVAFAPKPSCVATCISR